MILKLKILKLSTKKLFILFYVRVTISEIFQFENLEELGSTLHS